MSEQLALALVAASMGNLGVYIWAQARRWPQSLHRSVTLGMAQGVVVGSVLSLLWLWWLQ